MARRKAHQVDLPPSLGAWRMLSPSWSSRTAPSSRPKVAVILLIFMAAVSPCSSAARPKRTARSRAARSSPSPAAARRSRILRRKSPVRVSSSAPAPQVPADPGHIPEVGAVASPLQQAGQRGQVQPLHTALPGEKDPEDIGTGIFRQSR